MSAAAAAAALLAHQDRRVCNGNLRMDKDTL